MIPPKGTIQNPQCFLMVSLADFIRNIMVYPPVGTRHQPNSVDHGVTKVYQFGQSFKGLDNYSFKFTDFIAFPHG